jgi:DNA polymerase-3 subunit delta'
LIPFDISKLQSEVWANLARSYESGRIAGTYLFHGREGVGRWALAISLAALLNCEKPNKSDGEKASLMPCGRCRTCRSIFSLNFEGFYFALPIPPHKSFDEAIELTAEVLNLKRTEPFKILAPSANANIPIAVARDIKKRLSLKASADTVRLVLFYQMEKMLPASADALLKLIEEPPDNTVIVLAARKPESLLPTIQSRALKVRLKRIPENAIENYLKEKYGLSGKKAALSARLCDGSLGSAIEMAKASEEEDSSQRAVGFLLFKSLLSDSSPEVVSHIGDFLGPRDKGQAENLLTLWQSLVRDCANYAVSGDEKEVINIDFLSEIKKLAGYFAGHQLSFQMVDNIKITLADLQRNVHIHGALAALALRVKANMSGRARR